MFKSFRSFFEHNFDKFLDIYQHPEMPSSLCFQRYHLPKAFIMIIIIALYTLFGAICFCSFEATNELKILQRASEKSKGSLTL